MYFDNDILRTSVVESSSDEIPLPTNLPCHGHRVKFLHIFVNDMVCAFATFIILYVDNFDQYVTFCLFVVFTLPVSYPFDEGSVNYYTQ